MENYIEMLRPGSAEATRQQGREQKGAVPVTELGTVMLPLTGSGMLQQHESPEVQQ